MRSHKDGCARRVHRHKKTAAQGPCAAVQTSQMLQALFRDKNRIDYVNDTV
jgi:hypothetical protein